MKKWSLKCLILPLKKRIFEILFILIIVFPMLPIPDPIIAIPSTYQTITISLTKICFYFLVLLFILEAGYECYKRRKHKDKSLKISNRRIILRILFSAVIISVDWLSWSKSTWLGISWSETIWLGMYIGYITNALVTFLVLYIFIPWMKKNIAEQFGNSVGDILGDEEVKSKLVEWIKNDKRKALEEYLTPDKIKELINLVLRQLKIKSNSIKNIIDKLCSYKVVKPFVIEFLPKIKNKVKGLLDSELSRNRDSSLRGKLKRIGRSILGVDNQIRHSVLGAIDKVENIIKNITEKKFEKIKHEILNHDATNNFYVKTIEILETIPEQIPDEELIRIRDGLINRGIRKVEKEINKESKDGFFVETLSWLTNKEPKDSLFGETLSWLTGVVQEQIKKMKIERVSNMMDNIIGNILILIEALGLIFGFLFAYSSGQL